MCVAFDSPRSTPLLHRRDLRESVSNAKANLARTEILKGNRSQNTTGNVVVLARQEPALPIGENPVRQSLDALRSIQPTVGEWSAIWKRSTLTVVGNSSECARRTAASRPLIVPVASCQENAVGGDHNFVERQSRLGTVPLDKFINGMSVAARGLG